MKCPLLITMEDLIASLKTLGSRELLYPPIKSALPISKPHFPIIKNKIKNMFSIFFSLKSYFNNH